MASLGILTVVFIIAALLFAVSVVQGWATFATITFVFMIAIGAFSAIMVRSEK